MSLYEVFISPLPNGTALPSIVTLFRRLDVHLRNFKHLPVSGCHQAWLADVGWEKPELSDTKWI